MATATTPDQHTLGLDPLLGSLRDHGENVAERCRSAGECCARRRGGRSSLGNSPLQSHARLAPSGSRTGFLFAPRPPRRCTRLGPFIQFTVPIYIYIYMIFYDNGPCPIAVSLPYCVSVAWRFTHQREGLLNSSDCFKIGRWFILHWNSVNRDRMISQIYIY